MGIVDSYQRTGVPDERQPQTVLCHTKGTQVITPDRNVARHLNPLAMLIAGIVGSRKCHLPALAQKVPSGSKPQSRIRKRERWLTNKTIDPATYYLPYVPVV